MNIVYMHTNKITCKSYVGVTCKTINARWLQHCRNTKRRQKGLLQRAIIKYGNSDDIWEHRTLEENIKDSVAEEREIYWIEKFDTFNNGYNLTKGGKVFRGYNPPKGDSHWCTDISKYYFFHNEKGYFFGTVRDIAKEYNLKISSVHSLVKQKQLSLFGWHILCVLPKKDKKDKKIKEIKLVSDKPKKNSPKRGSEEHRKQCSLRTKGEKNGMFGKERPDYVKEAIRNRRREEADKTLRNWINDISGIVEKNISCLCLRDKYNLNISHLNIIAKKIKSKNGSQSKIHKGWRIIE